MNQYALKQTDGQQRHHRRHGKRGQLVAWIGLMLVLCIFARTARSAPDLKEAKRIIKQVQQKYQQVQSLRADFEQIFIWQLAGETQQVKGTIYLKEGNKYRIETNSQLIVTDGETVWTYSRPDSQVIIDQLNHAQGNPLPKDLLFQYAEEFEPAKFQEEELNGTKTFRINLVPKDEEGFITSMIIWVDKETLLTIKVEQTDINDNINTYFISNIKENTELEPSLFHFDVPEHSEIVDLRESNP